MWTPTTQAPCPFCASAELLGLSLGPAGGVIQCQQCHTSGPEGATHALAEAAWETRGRALPQPCLWCKQPYRPRSRYHVYCHVRCRLAAARERQEEEQDARLEHLRLQVRQAGQLKKRLARLEARRTRAEEALQHQWTLASG